MMGNPAVSNYSYALRSGTVFPLRTYILDGPHCTRIRTSIRPLTAQRCIARKHFGIDTLYRLSNN